MRDCIKVNVVKILMHYIYIRKIKKDNIKNFYIYTDDSYNYYIYESLDCNRIHHFFFPLVAGMNLLSLTALLIFHELIVIFFNFLHKLFKF